VGTVVGFRIVGMTTATQQLLDAGASLRAEQTAIDYVLSDVRELRRRAAGARWNDSWRGQAERLFSDRVAELESVLERACSALETARDSAGRAAGTIAARD
jgi:uncharacterized protein YukE